MIAFAFADPDLFDLEVLDQARQAVASTVALILTGRARGVRWLPRERRDRPGVPASRQPVRRLAAPKHLRTVSDRHTAALTHEHHVYSGRENTAPFDAR